LDIEEAEEGEMLIVDVVKVGEERAPKCLTDEKESKD
jgi:hypothetical protein